MASILDILWTRTWWTYEPDTAPPLSHAYHFFNLLEGGVWTEPLEELLSGCSQAKLTVLIVRMVEQRPDLEAWLELAL